MGYTIAKLTADTAETVCMEFTQNVGSKSVPRTVQITGTFNVSALSPKRRYAEIVKSWKISKHFRDMITAKVKTAGGFVEGMSIDLGIQRLAESDFAPLREERGEVTTRTSAADALLKKAGLSVDDLQAMIEAFAAAQAEAGE